MSLINKMLQDLDARGGLAPGAEPQLVKPVLRPERALVPRIALAVGAAAVLAVAAWFGWRAQHPRVPAPAVVAATPAAMPLARVPAGMVRITPPQPATVPVVAPASKPPSPDVAEPVAAAPVPAPMVAPAMVPVTAPVIARPVSKAVKPVLMQEETPPEGGAVTRSTGPAGPRGSEAEYRRALADLQDGRVTEAIATLEHTLQLDPRHDAARQTLVGLLVEAHRIDEAVRQLQLGLGLDPRQAAMAMLLARLQLEAGAGAAAIDTLQRTLPYAKGNGDYQAFYAGVLERQQRHGDAAAQYQAALATTPGNPLWLMGLGIALQGDNRNGEALAAYQAASASGALPAELQAFVERKLRQLKQ